LHNLDEHVTQVGKILAANLYPDTVFGCPINDQLLSNFFGSFLFSAGLLIPTSFATEKSTCVFLNQMIATIDAFLQATKEPDLENFQPQRYFTALHSTMPIAGSKVKRKPDLVLVMTLNNVSELSLYSRLVLSEVLLSTVVV
jgi:hypothetical protein